MSPRPPRVLALSEARIPSAVLGVDAVFEHLQRDSLCEFRARSSIDLDPAEIAWADAVVLVRGASPAERRTAIEARRLGRFVATYMDDDLERVPADARSGYFFTSAVVRANVAAIVAGADAVYCCSERLAAELATRHGRPAVLLRQPRPPRLPGERTPAEPPSGGGPVRIGFLGSVDHAAFLDDLLAAPLRRLVRERRESIELVFCGATPALARELGARSEPFEADFGAWRRRALGLGLAIGLAPLPESPFHRMKYFNKYLEYGSLGVAGVYSLGSPNADVVIDGGTGILCANEPDAWDAAIRGLLDDPGRRERIARAAWADVEERFSADALSAAWRAALAPLLAHRAPPVSPGQVLLPRGKSRWVLDRLAVYGPLRFVERLAGRATGRLKPG